MFDLPISSYFSLNRSVKYKLFFPLLRLLRKCNMNYALPCLKSSSSKWEYSNIIEFEYLVYLVKSEPKISKSKSKKYFKS